MCALSCCSPLHDEGQSECLLWHSTQSDYLHSGDQAHVQTFLPKVDMTSSEHCMMRYQWCGAFGWWHLHHICIRVGGIKGWMHEGRASQLWNFRCRAYRAELIPSRVLWCISTPGQPGILYLTTTKMCLVYWLISIGIFLQSEPCLLNLAAWVAIKPMDPARRTRVPGDKDCHA